MSTPDVSIIIVSWNVADLLRDCLMSIRTAGQGLALEVIVIDNHSTDGSTDLVQREFPEVHLFPQSENLGFSRAVNIGIHASHGRTLFLLNPDATLNATTLPTLLGYLDSHADVGIVGPNIVNADGSRQISVNRFPTFLDQAIILTKLDHVWHNLAPIRDYTYADTSFDKPTRVDQVKGAAYLFRRTLLDELGTFDERFFLWFEEVDYCRRAANKGIGTVIVPNAEVRHHGGRSFHQRYSIDKHRIFLHSLFMYFHVHRPRWEQCALLPFLGLSYLAHLLATPFHSR